MTLPDKPYFKYWGKAEREEDGKPPRYHLLPYHCLDVAAVGDALLSRHKKLREFFSVHSRLDSGTVTSLILYFLALHDLGKFSEAFQGLRGDLLLLLNQREKSKVYDSFRHDSLGFFLWDDQVGEEFCTTFPENKHEVYLWMDFWGIWAQAFMGHHGQPPKGCNKAISRYYLPENIAAAREFSEYSKTRFLNGISLTPPLPVIEWLEVMKLLSWWLAGFTVFCDWLGSNSDFFHPYQEPLSLDVYWQEIALPAAQRAVDSIGFLPISPAPQVSIGDMFGYVKQATPLQELSGSIQLGEGPQLFILEDVTGSGKTEAALMLLHRLMSGGMAEGAYVALPTMATSNAMYLRTQKVYQKLFNKDCLPSLVLAHGARHLVDGFVDTVLGEDPHSEAAYAENDISAGGYCNAWLADNSKKALLAHVGVGTIDQALLAVLQSRHQSLRLLGLRNKVLIVDEVHASDAYMHSLLQKLLTFHAASGGSAILLSATLPCKMRRELLEAYAAGLGKDAPLAGEKGYPLLSMLGTNGFREQEMATRPAVKRELACEFLSTEQEVKDLILKNVADGKCVAWIRNTVNDALEAYEELKSFILEENLNLFHARFALADRLDIEEKVLSLFGKESRAGERQGKVLIATQVVEQSLDLDFDCLVSDLAPIDLLIQRAGRLQRHARDRKGNPVNGDDERGTPQLHVLSPEPVLDADADWFSVLFPKAVGVYEDHGRLWLTSRYLFEKKKVRIPEDMRRAIEHVYGEGSEGNIPGGLLNRSLDAETTTMVQKSQARMNSIEFEDGYSMPDHEWWDETVTPTRLGDPTVTLRLAKWQNGELHPLADARKNAWSLSEVRVRQNLASQELKPEDLQLAVAMDEIKNHWPGRQTAFCLLVPLREVEPELWEGEVSDHKGNPVILRYSRKIGLRVKSPQVRGT